MIELGHPKRSQTEWWYHGQTQYSSRHCTEII